MFKGGRNHVPGPFEGHDISLLRAAVTKYRRLGCLTNRKYFPSFLEAGSPRQRQQLVSGESFPSELQRAKAAFAVCAQGERQGLSRLPL